MNQNVLEAKKAIVGELTDLLKTSNSVVVAEYRGLNVAELTELRKELLKKNAKMGVYKNSLFTRAVDELGHEDLNQYLVGPNAYITCEDPLEGPKVVTKFAKKHENLIIKGGLIEGKVMSADEIKDLAKLPNREGVLSMLLSVLQAPVRSFACAVKAIADKQQ